MDPTVSVVMPVRNAGHFLLDTLASVFGQTFADFEFVVVDDGSTDDTAAILAAETDPRLRVVTQQNAGLVASMNRAVLLARGKYVARMDADDRCEPDRLARQVAFLDAHPEVAIVGGAISTMDQDGVQLAPKVLFPATHEQIWAAVGKRPWVMCHPTVMFRRQLAIDAGLYLPWFEYAEDTEFIARMMTVGRAANLPDVLLHYRLNRGSASLNKGRMALLKAQLVGRTVDAWKPGTPFQPADAERKAVDAALAKCTDVLTVSQAEAAYQIRIGRELLRARKWSTAFRRYASALKATPTNRRAVIGLACAVLRVGGGPA